MPGPLIEPAVIAEIKTQLANMEFVIPIFDQQGHQTGTQTIHPMGPMIEQLSNALGTAIFNILKQQVLIQVTTDPDQAVQVNPTTGTGFTVSPGTGTGIVE